MAGDKRAQAPQAFNLPPACVLGLSVRVSPISKSAAVLIVVIGAFVLLTGLVARVLVNEVVGVAFMVLGVMLYALLLRLTRRLRSDVSRATR